MEYIIYKIVINDNVYIGSTKNFNLRKSQHKLATMKKVDKKLYNMINENGGWVNVNCVPIEKMICNDVMEARIREEHFRQLYNANLNLIKAYATEEEKKESFKSYYKQYVEDNKDHLKEVWHKNYTNKKDKYIQTAMNKYYFNKEFKSMCQSFEAFI
jgi:hypothetical protein